MVSSAAAHRGWRDLCSLPAGTALPRNKLEPQHVSGLARPQDFAYPGNRSIALAAAGTFAAVLLWKGLARDEAGGGPSVAEPPPRPKLNPAQPR